MVANSFGAVVVLVANGYGGDALRVARSMYEGAVIVGYIQKHPEVFDTYYEFHWVLAKRSVDWMTEHAPEELKKLDPKKVKEIEDNFARVKPNYQTEKGKIRDSWSKTPLRNMAEDIGMADLHSYYEQASSMHHANVQALSSQLEVSADETIVDFDVAPSDHWAGEALMLAMGSFVQALKGYNALCGKKFDALVEDVEGKFTNAWKKQLAREGKGTGAGDGI